MSSFCVSYWTISNPLHRHFRVRYHRLITFVFIPLGKLSLSAIFLTQHVSNFRVNVHYYAAVYVSVIIYGSLLDKDDGNSHECNRFCDSSFQKDICSPNMAMLQCLVFCILSSLLLVYMYVVFCIIHKARKIMGSFLWQ